MPVFAVALSRRSTYHQDASQARAEGPSYSANATTTVATTTQTPTTTAATILSALSSDSVTQRGEPGPERRALTEISWIVYIRHGDT